MADLVPAERQIAFVPNRSYTLADYQNRMKSPLMEKFVTDLYQQTNTILKDLPLTIKPDLSVRGQRLTNSGLDRVHWRRINDLPVPYKATFEGYEEQLYITRDTIPIDRALKEQTNWAGDPIGDQFAAYQASMSYEINDAFINGAPGDQALMLDGANTLSLVDTPRIVGLKYRLDHNSAYGTLAANKFNSAATGSTLSVSQTKAQAQRMLVLFNQQLQRLKSPDGTDVVCYGNDNSVLLFENVIRTLGDGAGLKITDDAFDRTVNMFKNVKIRSLGTLQDGVTPVIPNNENADGSYPMRTITDTAGNSAQVRDTRSVADGGPADAFTSLYFVKYGPNGLRGWQPRPLEPENLGRSRENGVRYNILMDWGMGLLQPSQFSTTRIFGLPVTA